MAMSRSRVMCEDIEAVYIRRLSAPIDSDGQQFTNTVITHMPKITSCLCGERPARPSPPHGAVDETKVRRLTPLADR